MKELLEAGVHFGHQTRKWNPKMKEYIFGERNGIHIIDLQKTLKLFKDAARYVTDTVATGRNVLFVGTKRQAQEAIAEEAKRCGMFFINNRWLGGLLTNHVTVQKSVQRLKEIEAMSTDGRYEMLTKKEVSKLERERKHLEQNLAGIKNMPGLPDLIFIIDSNMEEIAVSEARKLGIPVVSVVDTNCDPHVVTFPIPGNDDALRAIRAARRPVCLFGHTHVPAAYILGTNAELSMVPMTRVSPLDIPLGFGRTLINVGAVGQPRDGDSRAAFGLYNTDTRTVTLMRETYDISVAQQKIIAAGLPEVLAHRLALGR